MPQARHQLASYTFLHRLNPSGNLNKRITAKDEGTSQTMTTMAIIRIAGPQDQRQLLGGVALTMDREVGMTMTIDNWYGAARGGIRVAVRIW